MYIVDYAWKYYCHVAESNESMSVLLYAID